MLGTDLELLPGAVLISSQKRDLSAFGRLEYNSRNSELRRPNFNLDHRLVLVKLVLTREAIRSELWRVTIIKAQFQTVNCESHIRLYVDQLALCEQLMIGLAQVWVLEFSTLFQPTNLKRYYLACGDGLLRHDTDFFPGDFYAV